MFGVSASPMPPEALLGDYTRSGAFTDCYAAEIAGAVTHARYVEAFYTTWLFRLERLILHWAVARPSTDAQAQQLADGRLESFAAWHVERRAADQLLLSDFQGRTRSWLMIAPVESGGEARTRLYFGSAVVPARKSETGRPVLGFVFSALLGFHKLYSYMLLHAAKSRLKSRPRA